MNYHPAMQTRFSPNVSWKPILVLIVGIAVFFALTGKIYQIRGKYIEETVSEFGQLPSAVVQAASLEFNGIVSDYLLFKTMTYMGLRLIEKKNPTMDEWQVIHQMLERITDLDPGFFDPYLFAEMMLVWHAGMIDETNALLEKGGQHRPYDYRPYYFIGFNYLYFEKDAEKAAPYLRLAAERPNAPNYIRGLASRVSVYAGELSIGIFFLEGLIQNTQDPATLAYFEKRLAAMKSMLYLEEKTREYQEAFGVLPESLDELVSSGIISKIPADPYGGEFVLLDNGRVYTTSELVIKEE